MKPRLATVVAVFPRLARTDGDEASRLSPLRPPSVLRFAVFNPGEFEVQLWTPSDWAALRPDERPEAYRLDEGTGVRWLVRSLR